MRQTLNRFLLAWAIAMTAILVVATSDDDPEGMAVAAEQMREAAALEAAQVEAAKGARK